jgi:hypothetical protein
MELIYVTCPHCNGLIEIHRNEVNCAIFRHDPALSPHASKEECDALASSGQMLGCGKPFRLLQVENEYKAVICEYI